MSTVPNPPSKNVLNSDVEVKGTLKFSGELTFDGKLDGEIPGSSQNAECVGEKFFGGKIGWAAERDFCVCDVRDARQRESAQRLALEIEAD